MEFEIRPVRSPQGRRKLVAERQRYFELMQQGYSSRAACRAVGIKHQDWSRVAQRPLETQQQETAPTITETGDRGGCYAVSVPV